ncbi:MAG: isochorismate synthase, partial [bacterium]|nr:isochorismate synthase [bacterium]
ETGPLDLLQWLDSQKDNTKIYFSGRDKIDIETAATGAVDTIYIPGNTPPASPAAKSDTSFIETAFSCMQANFSPLYPNLRYYGGFSFSPGHIDEDWETFGACRFVIPQFELFMKNRRTFLACNMKIHRDSPTPLSSQLEKTIADLERLNLNEQTKTNRESHFHKPGKLISRTDSPGYEQWEENLTRVIKEIKNRRYHKTVPARKVNLLLQNNINPVTILSFLKNLPTKRYDFLFQFDGEKTYTGSSPERLYKRKGRNIESEAIAGTRVRGKKEQDDKRLAKELMDSNKEQREHDFVIDTIKEDLGALCETMEADNQKSLLKLKEGQHLSSHIKGVLKENVNDGMLIKTLHPTPAVAGCPLDKALEAISQCEPFKRGWYAGIIGTAGYDSGDFAVGIRSGFIYKNRLSLYSGVGVVEGSNPEDEWNELDCKIVNFMDMI